MERDEADRLSAVEADRLAAAGADRLAAAEADRQAAAGASERLSELFERHGRDVLAYAVRRASPDDAADLVAETFLVAWRRLDRIPPEPEARLWLYGVARRALLNQRRGARRRERLGEALRSQAQAALDARPVDERSEKLLGALSALDPQDRELLLLIGWEELSPAQAARVLELSPAATRVRLHRARRRLRSALAEESPANKLCEPRAQIEEAR